MVRDGTGVPGGLGWTPRRPGTIPDEVDAGPPGIDVRAGTDTDGNGTADTLLTVEGADLVVHVDLDGDGFADRVLHVGTGGAAPDVASEPDAASAADGSAAAVASWSAWVGRLFG
jgi:hypothetical protein